MARRIGAVIFDLGGVLIDWDPRYLYRSMFGGDEVAMERFLAEVTTPDWNAEQDAGRTWDEAIALLVAAHPDERVRIEAYRDRWEEMLGDAHAGTVAVLEELRRVGLRLYALTNWSAETFPIARRRFPFLDWFDGIVVSGQERLAKPDPGIFRLLLERYGLEAAATVFIDDSRANVAAAESLGFQAIRFTHAEALRAALVGLGVLDAAGADTSGGDTDGVTDGTWSPPPRSGP